TLQPEQGRVTKRDATSRGKLNFLSVDNCPDNDAPTRVRRDISGPIPYGLVRILGISRVFSPAHSHQAVRFGVAQKGPTTYRPPKQDSDVRPIFGKDYR